MIQASRDGGGSKNKASGSPEVRHLLGELVLSNVEGEFMV